MAEHHQTEDNQKERWLPETHWTDIMAARREGSAQAAEALNRLCSTYWYPVYAYVRRKGHSDADTKDITQAFFFHVLERNLLGAADRTRGKFRNFLLASLNYFMANRREFENAQKRGGGAVILSMDEAPPENRYALEPSSDVSPERLFERQWALTLLEQAHTRLRQEYSRQRKEHLFDRLKAFIIEETASGEYGPAAQDLGMTSGAVATAVHRLRQRYRELIDSEISQTVASRDEIPNERQYIYEVLSLA